MQPGRGARDALQGTTKGAQYWIRPSVFCVEQYINPGEGLAYVDDASEAVTHTGNMIRLYDSRSDVRPRVSASARDRQKKYKQRQGSS